MENRILLNEEDEKRWETFSEEKKNSLLDYALYLSDEYANGGKVTLADISTAQSFGA